MKKIIAFLIALILCLVPVTSSAEDLTTDATKLLMGDANQDGNVDAYDARLVLRVAAQLENENTVNLNNVDTDGDKNITAADARIILRFSASLTNFVYGFDSNGKPCALKVLRSNQYSVKMTYVDPSVDFGNITMTLAKNLNDIYMVSNDPSKLMGDDAGIDMSHYTSCGIMIKDALLHLLLADKDANAAMPIPDAAGDALGLSKTEATEMFDMAAEMITSLLPDDIGTASKTTLDGEDVYYYSYEILGQLCLLYVAENGKLIRIDEVAATGNKTLLSFDDVSEDPSSYFDLNQYEII